MNSPENTRVIWGSLEEITDDPLNDEYEGDEDEDDYIKEQNVLNALLSFLDFVRAYNSQYAFGVGENMDMYNLTAFVNEIEQRYKNDLECTDPVGKEEHENEQCVS